MKILTKLFFIILLVLFTSCEEDFNLKTDYKPKYALNCIIRADTTYHTATILKSYEVDGFDPYVYTDDPFISGADIRIWQGNNVYFFRDTTAPRPDTSRFNFLQKYYYIQNFKTVSNDFLEIKAVLDNGKVLEGVTQIPKIMSLDSSSTRILRPGQDVFRVYWISNNVYGRFLLRLQLNYRRGNGPTESVDIPVRYEGDTPVYPAVTKNSGAAFKWDAFERTLRKISDGEDKKELFTIYGVLAEILIFDENLSKYYANMHGYMDDFTVRVDQNDFSNIEGGFGIFGSYIKQKRGIQIDQDYIISLGYRPQ
jgi:hypothetical protein